MNSGIDILTPWGFGDLPFRDLVALPLFTLSVKGALLAPRVPLTLAGGPLFLIDGVDDLERAIFPTPGVGDLLRAGRSPRLTSAYRPIVR